MIDADILNLVFEYLPNVSDKRNLKKTSQLFSILAEARPSKKRVELTGNLHTIIEFVKEEISLETAYLEHLCLGQHLVSNDHVLIGQLLELLAKWFDQCPNLKSLQLYDNSASVLFRDPLLIQPLFRNSLVHITIGGQQDSMYCGDQVIKDMVNACPNLKEFHDLQAYGLTMQSVTRIGKKCPLLARLSLNNQSHHVLYFCRYIPLFNNLTHLSLTRFGSSLIDNFAEFHLGLAKLPLLAFLKLDLSESPFLDGLVVEHFETVLRHCGNLGNLEYISSVETYYNVKDDIIVNHVKWTSNGTLLNHTKIANGPQELQDWRVTAFEEILKSLATFLDRQQGLKFKIECVE